MRCSTHVRTSGNPFILPLGESSKAVKLADLNGDGLIDILVADADSVTVAVLLKLSEAGFDRPRYTARSIGRIDDCGAAFVPRAEARPALMKVNAPR